MKHVEGHARGTTTASLDECLELVRRLDEYPSWHGAVVRAVQVRERDAGGRPTMADATLRVAIAPLQSDYELTIALRHVGPREVALERVANDSSDRERLKISWRFEPRQERLIELGVEFDAELDVPRVVPVGGIGNRLAQGFVAAACEALRAKDDGRDPPGQEVHR